MGLLNIIRSKYSSLKNPPISEQYLINSTRNKARHVLRASERNLKSAGECRGRLNSRECSLSNVVYRLKTKNTLCLSIICIKAIILRHDSIAITNNAPASKLPTSEFAEWWDTCVECNPSPKKWKSSTRRIRKQLYLSRFRMQAYISFIV